MSVGHDGWNILNSFATPLFFNLKLYDSSRIADELKMKIKSKYNEPKQYSKAINHMITCIEIGFTSVGSSGPIRFKCLSTELGSLRGPRAFCQFCEQTKDCLPKGAGVNEEGLNQQANLSL